MQARVRQHLVGIIGSRMGGSWGALLCSGVMFFFSFGESLDYRLGVDVEEVGLFQNTCTHKQKHQDY